MEIIFAELSENPGRIIFELEVVSCRRRKLVPNTAQSVMVNGPLYKVIK